MPRILVTTDGPSRQLCLDEPVVLEHLDDEHCSVQLLGRLAQGLEEAARAEDRFAATVAPTSHLRVAAS